MQTDPGTFSIRRRRLDHEHAVVLIAQVQAEYVRRYGGPDESPIDPLHFEDPHGAFFIGYRGQEPVAMGGWRVHGVPDGVAAATAVEIKRMYVVPDQRGHGYARAVLAHLEETARAAGAEAMVLETGIEQPEAISLYESCEYRPIPAFGFYAGASLSRHYGKVLADCTP